MAVFWLVASGLELFIAIAATFRGDVELYRHCITLCFLFQILSNQWKERGNG